jgi:hypothetical protein
MGGGMGMMGGMGGMGGGMGGMGGGMGMMGGMRGGGFRSVPPTGLPMTSLQPGQTRKLPTGLVSLNGPTEQGLVSLPAKGEVLELGDVSEITQSDAVRKALTLLTAEKAPATVTQLVLWRVGTGMDWTTIGRASRRWANSSELALAQKFVATLNERDAKTGAETGTLYVSVEAAEPGAEAVAAEVRKALEGAFVLGLVAQPKLPEQPSGPAVACRLKLSGTAEEPSAVVEVASSDVAGRKWVSAGKFSLAPRHLKADQRPYVLVDALASGLLDRLVKVTMLRERGHDREGHGTYTLRIDNASPLVLNGLAITGSNAKDDTVPTTLLGINVSPRKNLRVPASKEAVERLGLKDGIKTFAADLSGL